MKKVLVFLLCLISLNVFSGERSSEWTKVRKQHLMYEPVCQLCGIQKSREVHHVINFKLMPKLELEQSNLITVCSSRYLGFNCHFDVAHAGNFRFYNPWVYEDIAYIKGILNKNDNKLTADAEAEIHDYLKYIHNRTAKFNKIINAFIYEDSAKDDKGNLTEETFEKVNTIRIELTEG